MQEKFPKISEAERLRMDNDFLKMKLMLERGAKFTESSGDGSLPPDVENRFLKQVIAFEDAFQHKRAVKIFEKVGSPTQFLPASEIPEHEMDRAWRNLSRYLFKYGITVGTCNPAVTRRDLYRFATEELFVEEMMDINVPGMIYGFIYDEFHPDPVFENTETAKQDVMGWIFGEQVEYITIDFAKTGTQVNNVFYTDRESVKSRVKLFRRNYDRFDGLKLTDIETDHHPDRSEIMGNYVVTAFYDDLEILLEGKWQVSFFLNSQTDHSEIRNVRITGIDL